MLDFDWAKSSTHPGFDVNKIIAKLPVTLCTEQHTVPVGRVVVPSSAQLLYTAHRNKLHDGLSVDGCIHTLRNDGSFSLRWDHGGQRPTAKRSCWLDRGSEEVCYSIYHNGVIDRSHSFELHVTRSHHASWQVSSTSAFRLLLLPLVCSSRRRYAVRTPIARGDFLGQFDFISKVLSLWCNGI